MNNTKYEFRCEICSGKFDANYNIPKVLSCGHTVCSKCIERMREKGINKCPFDRKFLDFDDENVIAINYYILSLIDNSVKGGGLLSLATEDEEFKLDPKPVVNSPGWKNTLDGFIKDNVMFSVESNGFIYCTDLATGEWWFLYHNQFFGNFFFQAEGKMYLIDQYGSLYQIFNKNYYVQVGKKNAWKAVTFVTPMGGSMYTIEGNKLMNTNLTTGKSKEVQVNHCKLISEDTKIFKNINMMISTGKYILFSNKNGELFSFNDETQELRLITSNFSKAIESYSVNSTHLYYIEKNSKSVYRTQINFKKNLNSTTISLSEVMEKLDMIKQGETYSKSFLEVEKFMELDFVPLKIIANDNKIVLIDKVGDIHVNDLLQPKPKLTCFQCLFMLRNCNLSNTTLVGDGDLLILDPIRLSLNKLNILAGTEVIILHSTKFLYSIKNIFCANSRIYFIDVSGNLYYFNEMDKKLTQIGNNGICKYITEFGVYKNYLITIENNTMYRTNLTDGNYMEIKNDYSKDYEFFFADGSGVVFITKQDEIISLTLNLSNNTLEKSNSNNNVDLASSGGLGANTNNNSVKLKSQFKFNGISSVSAMCLFRNNLIFYRNRNIESINLDDQSHKVMVEDFPDVNMFISNNEFLACILKDGVIYKL
jgi:hypothetical protein